MTKTSSQLETNQKMQEQTRMSKSKVRTEDISLTFKLQESLDRKMSMDFVKECCSFCIMHNTCCFLSFLDNQAIYHCMPYDWGGLRH